MDGQGDGLHSVAVGDEGEEAGGYGGPVVVGVGGECGELGGPYEHDDGGDEGDEGDEADEADEACVADGADEACEQVDGNKREKWLGRRGFEQQEQAFEPELGHEQSPLHLAGHGASWQETTPSYGLGIFAGADGQQGVSALSVRWG